MKDIIKLLCSIIGCELVGILGTPFSIAAIPTWYTSLNKPFFSPPTWIFGPVWTILYFLMGVSFYLILQKGWKKKAVKNAGMFFIAQLALNFLWSPIFFGLKSPLLGLITIVAMWILIITTMKKFYPLSKLAFYLLIPYLLWVSFATVLNAAILILN
jgi:tryptophan-rich sensory protein